MDGVDGMGEVDKKNGKLELGTAELEVVESGLVEPGSVVQGVPSAEPPQDLLTVPVGPGPLEQLAERVFLGEDGLRAGWSMALFGLLWMIVAGVVGAFFYGAHLITEKQTFNVQTAIFGELVPFAGLVAAAAALALIERRKGNLLSYNLLGSARLKKFSIGLGSGFLALAVLIGGLKAGGWIQLAGSGLTAGEIARYGLLWGVAFLLVGGFEEGMFRCYLQATLTRGINLWWALGLEAVLAVATALRTKGLGSLGVYACVALGLAPCVLLHVRKSESAGFWQAAWVTSTLFGYVHTGNGGENWVGILAAAAIGFVFVVSVRVTGSAWWAIGFHTAWDWAETFFFGTADSGLPAQGSWLAAKPVGNALWSGGANGPEGSLLVLVVILATLAGLMAWASRSGPELPEAGLSLLSFKRGRI